MGIISRLFGGNNKPQHDDKPPIYGGDGLSDRSPAIINCASMAMAQALIDGFISERCGSGSEHKFYFDLSRPVAVAMKMSGL